MIFKKIKVLPQSVGDRRGWWRLISGSLYADNPKATLAVNPAADCHYFLQASGYLPSVTASPPSAGMRISTAFWTEARVFERLNAVWLELNGWVSIESAKPATSIEWPVQCLTYTALPWHWGRWTGLWWRTQKNNSAVFDQDAVWYAIVHLRANELHGLFGIKWTQKNTCMGWIIALRWETQDERRPSEREGEWEGDASDSTPLSLYKLRRCRTMGTATFINRLDVT